MKILIDMNLSPQWVQEFQIHGIDAVHWSTVGAFDAPDTDIMNWAIQHHHIVFTHDLDFGTALALTGAQKPSVVQVRTQNVTIEHIGEMVINAIKKYQQFLEQGALVVLDENKGRIKILPLMNG